MELPRLYQTSVIKPPPNSRPFWVMSKDKVRLRITHTKADEKTKCRGTVFIMTGRSEFTEKFFNITFGFQQRGFDGVSIDWRGQGLSERLLPNKRKGHIENFDDYYADFAAIMKRAKEMNLPRPYIIYGHSMGGLLGLKFLTDYNDFKAGLIVAPMMNLNFNPLLHILNLIVPKLQIMLGRGDRFAVSCDERNTYERDFKDNQLTNDRSRFNELADLMKTAPELVVGGVTWHWVNAANNAMRDLRDYLDPKCRFLTIIGAGDDVVCNNTARNFSEKHSMGEFVNIENALHEPMQENAETRKHTWEVIDAFLEKCDV